MTEMKEYHIVGSRLLNVISKVNEMAKQGWVPTHFAMVTDNDVDTFGVLLERESREPIPKRGDS